MNCAKASKTSIPARRTKARSDRRALTLFELLITLVILIGMAGVSFVALMPLLGGARLDESARLCAHHLQMARAHARLTGRPVVVRSWRDAEGVTLLESRTLVVFGLGDPLEALADIDTLRGIAAAPEAEDADVEADLVAGAMIAESWAATTLPRSIRLERVAPGGEVRGVRPMWMDEVVADTSMDAALVLAVYLPDGSAIAPGAVFVLGDEDRTVELTIEPWTGRAQRRAVTAAPDDEGVVETETEAKPFADSFGESVP